MERTDLIAVEIEVDFKNNEFQVTNTCTRKKE